jgi:hypothetical protein
LSALRIGMVDLDTSHPASWLPVVRSLGHGVVGVYDSGTVYPEGHAESFASEHGIANVFRSLEEMAESVDTAFVHSCDWDAHVERARLFVRAGKAVLIDKPLAGNLRDLRQLIDWERQGARVTGGSALRYCYEVREWLENHDPRDVVYACAGCSVDDFNYGIHAYSLLHGLLGPGVESARHLGAHGQHHVELAWRDGRRAEVSVGETEGYLPFYATVATGSDVTHLEVDSSRLYRALLETALPYLAGDAPAPVPLEALIEPELAAIAARVSERGGGERVFLSEISEDDPGYDGNEFAARYRAQRNSF